MCSILQTVERQEKTLHCQYKPVRGLLKTMPILCKLHIEFKNWKDYHLPAPKKITPNSNIDLVEQNNFSRWRLIFVPFSSYKFELNQNSVRYNKISLQYQPNFVNITHIGSTH